MEILGGLVAFGLLHFFLLALGKEDEHASNIERIRSAISDIQAI